MTFAKRLAVLSLVAFSFVLLTTSFAQKAAPPSKAMKKVENTDPALRMKWVDQHAAMKASTPYKDFKWRFIGPDIIGGRCVDVDVPKGSRTVIYVASAVGGLWKTENTGITWECLTNELPTLSSGDIAISESDPNIIYYGTGEANIFRSSMAGTGVYKSTDAGKTWQSVGLTGTYTIGRIRVHPTNPDIVYVAAPGHEWTYSPDRGVYKTTDGGKTWQKILYLDEKIGAIDLVMDPKNPETLIASMCHRIRLRWSDPVPEPGDGLFKTTDGGKTWKDANKGLPDTKFTGRIGLDLCLGKPNVVYAYVDNHTPVREPAAGARDSYGRLRTFPDFAGAEVYRSDDEGESWTKVSVSDRTMERFGGTYGWVFGQVRVDPSDENTVYIMGVGFSKSTDGGKTFKGINYEGLHSDHHALWIDPKDSNYIINANDGGANASYDGGKTWRDFHKGIPSIQFYNVTLDMNKPFAAYGSVQDQGTYRVLGLGQTAAQQPGQRRGRGTPLRWETAPGGEGTIIAVDPSDPNIEYASSYYGRVERSEYVNGAWVSKEIYPKPAPGEGEYRGQWLAPTILSPHNQGIVYHGFQHVFRSMNRGETWDKISPDLTYNDPQKQGKLPYAIFFATLTALAESPFQFGVLYAGSDDGRVWVTKDSGLNWTEITAGLPYNKHVWCLTASKSDPATVYVALIGRHDDDLAPYVFKSSDYGKTWVNIGAGIPAGSTNVIREDPKKSGVLYCGTDLGVYVTTDGAKTWNYLGSGLPNVAVWDLQVHPRDSVLVLATNGRGMWVLDDVSSLQK